MGKRSKRQRNTMKATRNIRSRRDDTILGEDVNDEIDAFHKQREMIPLDVNKDTGDSDDDLEEPVFDLEFCIAYNLIQSQLHVYPTPFARQAKYLQQKFGGGKDEMSDDDDDQVEERKAVWDSTCKAIDNGQKLKLQSSDEDLPMEEEAEVLKIQREKAKSLSLEDFGLEDIEQEEDDSDGKEQTFQELANDKAIKKPVIGAVLDDTSTSYEEVKKDLNALSKEEKMDVVYSCAPELIGLLSELNIALDQLKQVEPQESKVIAKGNDKAKGGMDYAEVKRILLLAYCQAIGFYLLLKSEGHPVRDHPVIARLVEIKNLWEKMKHLTPKCHLQFKDAGNHDYESISKVNDEKATFELEHRLADVAAKSLTATEIAEDLKDGSKNLQTINTIKKHQDAQPDVKSIEMMKLRENLEAKLKEKGVYNLIKKGSEAPKRNLERVNHFDDDVRHAAKRHGSSSMSKFARFIATKSNGQKFVSGDVDLPKRDDIAERRRKHELRVLAGAGITSMDDGDGEEGNDDLWDDHMKNDQQNGEELESEDEFYREVKKQRTQKITAKTKLFSRAGIMPVEEPGADGKRHITSQMEKNRGLTRNRKKLTKNPRRKYKIKHQKALIRRKGQVRDIRKPTGAYGGEATGININVSRSVRFKS
ncbi:hypothetical protein AXF42_Ash016736 [Apostasia shenzhenica]|uniref:Sas10 C-terminal domain-containing protein n=1 Tax=Apostasia shenzhenica TaxID=1088818 RepID=A0A2I0AQ63_9ASPA|nr:hypothetical protein AXF42_Ash016736 [Apostasia shenzhenica]